MSITSKLVLITACSTTIGIVGYVHYKQQYDRQQLHEGVIRDVERQRKRKTENLYNLQKQIDLTKEIKKQAAQYEELEKS